MFQGGVEFIRKLISPDRFTASTIAFWVSSLDHKRLDHSVEDHVGVVPLLRMRSEVLHSLGALLSKQVSVDFSIRSIQDHFGGQVIHLNSFGLSGLLGSLAYLFIVHVTPQFLSATIHGLSPREHVESVLLEGGSDEGWVQLGI